MNSPVLTVDSEGKLLGAALALGARRVRGLSTAEEKALAGAEASGPVPTATLHALEVAIRAGLDPLGDLFARLRSAEERRPLGATYTPLPIVSMMADWAVRQAKKDRAPARIVDPGVGSARFLVEAGRRFPKAQLVGIEVDPVAAILARATLSAAAMADRAEIIISDYRAAILPPIDGRTLYIGNPPYVRHHLIPAEWKEWLVTEARRLKLTASQLAGLHVHFFLKTALAAKPGDYGAFITAAEWLDVNYGRLVRELFVGPLGGHDLLVLEPTARAFPDAASTAAVATFVAGSKPRSIRLDRVGDLEAAEPLGEGRPIRRERLVSAPRWSHLLRAAPEAREDHVELGELCRVHRGSVTGANKVWIAGEHSAGLPESVLFRSVTRARELIAAGLLLEDATKLRHVIDLPVDLDVFDTAERRAIERFLRKAKAKGAHRSYVAEHRKAWWAVGLRPPPPMMATYMARRPPAFVRNRAQARYINIAHGLYPREPMTEPMMMKLVEHLCSTTSVTDGRTYAGGLTKFEPREMERILVPSPALLAAEA